MSKAPTIDAHVHLWDAARQDDILICAKNPQLNGQATAEGIERHLEHSPFSSAIIVQSAPNRDHCDWLVEQAMGYPWVAGVVSWLDPQDDLALEDVSRFAENPLICGIRLMVNRLENPEGLLQEGSLRVLERLGENEITIEVLARPDQLMLVDRLASSVSAHMVLDHCGNPPANAATDQEWRDTITRLSQNPRLATKFSGLMEAFETPPVGRDLDPLLDFLMDSFGSKRLMAASNLPVINLTASASRWLDVLSDWMVRRGVSATENMEVWGGSATRWYPKTVHASQAVAENSYREIQT